MSLSLSLSKEQQAEAIASIRRFFSEKLELELSQLRAGFLLDYFSAEIAPFAYNEGIADAQKFLVRLCEDLPSTCFQEPLTYQYAIPIPRVPSLSCSLIVDPALRRLGRHH